MTSDHAAAPGHGEAAHHGPTTSTYLIVAAVLVVITGVEVWIYYSPIAKMAIFVPSLLILSALKFFTVIAFYMHLKYDHKVFRTLFGGPFIIAIVTIVALLFLFGQIGVKLAK